jgi:glycosyltransferase involved in cell wall biosynthesis
VGAHPNVVEDGVNGLLMDQQATGLAAHMERVLSMPAEQLEQMGEAARGAAKRFSWSRIVPQYEQLYREVIGA